MNRNFSLIDVKNLKNTLKPRCALALPFSFENI